MCMVLDGQRYPGSGYYSSSEDSSGSENDEDNLTDTMINGNQQKIKKLKTKIYRSTHPNSPRISNAAIAQRRYRDNNPQLLMNEMSTKYEWNDRKDMQSGSAYNSTQREVAGHMQHTRTLSGNIKIIFVNVPSPPASVAATLTANEEKPTRKKRKRTKLKRRRKKDKAKPKTTKEQFWKANKVRE